jgi:hypothetical protein
MAQKNLTDNRNLLSPIGFKLTINNEKYANTEFFVTSIGIPEISAEEVQMKFRGETGYTSGEQRQFGALSLRMAIDEDMKNYTEIYDWLERNTKGHEECDMILSIMSSHSSVNKQLQFKSAFPTSLGGVEFSTQSTSIDYLQADVSFRYTEFVILK